MVYLDNVATFKAIYKDRCVYLDNAATSHFKPKCVYDSLTYDLKNSANSGRSGHRLAINCALGIEKARNYFTAKFGGDNLVFTKNCTEALNLAIFGYVKEGMRVVTTENEHNSVLRPLYALADRGIINLLVVPLKDGCLPFESLKTASKDADLVVVSLISNVLGTVTNISALGECLKDTKTKLLVDGAQGVPVLDVDMKKQHVDMLALPAHKGLHGVQGVGALLFNEDVSLNPIIYGGTGTESFSTEQPTTIPEGFEAGTQFSGGISAMHAGAYWTYARIDDYRNTLKTLSKECGKQLLNMGVKVYNKEFDSGIVTFNVGDKDSQDVASLLDDDGIAVRGGVHCAPLVHRHLGTTRQGAVRVSFGIDSTERDLIKLLSSVEKIKKGR